MNGSTLLDILSAEKLNPYLYTLRMENTLKIRRDCVQLTLDDGVLYIFTPGQHAGLPQGEDVFIKLPALRMISNKTLPNKGHKSYTTKVRKFQIVILPTASEKLLFFEGDIPIWPNGRFVRV